jgi:ParB/RepB/Spo0J family partition protein
MENSIENSKQCFEIDVNMIRIPTDRFRQTKNENGTTELTRSFSAHGQLQPILVKRDKVGCYEVVAGTRRLQAAMQAGFQKVTCMLRDEYTSLTSLEENLQREKLDPLDKAEAYYNTIIEMGWNQKVLAEKLGKSEASVSATLSLRNLAPEIKAKHRKEGALSEKQLLMVLGMGSLEEQMNAYKRAFNGEVPNAKRKKSSNGNPPVTEQIKNALVSLGRKVEHLDLTKLNPAEVANICGLMLSLVSRITFCAARIPNFDQQAASEIIRAETLALHHAVGRFDLSQVNVKDVNDFCGQIVLSLEGLVKSQNGRVGFNPIETLTAVGHLIVVLAQICGDKKALRVFREVVREIESSVRKIYGAEFSALNFLRRIARWA